MKPQGSSFERGRKLVVIFLVMAIVLCAYALLFTKEYSRENFVAVIGGFLCFAAMIVTATTLCRCPHCGKRIISGVLVLKVCPKCKRSLTTGEKIRK